MNVVFAGFLMPHEGNDKPRPSATCVWWLVRPGEDSVLKLNYRECPGTGSGVENGYKGSRCLAWEGDCGRDGDHLLHFVNSREEGKELAHGLQKAGGPPLESLLNPNPMPQPLPCSPAASGTAQTIGGLGEGDAGIPQKCPTGIADGESVLRISGTQ